jgi:PINIT domain
MANPTITTSVGTKTQQVLARRERECRKLDETKVEEIVTKMTLLNPRLRIPEQTRKCRYATIDWFLSHHFGTANDKKSDWMARKNALLNVRFVLKWIDDAVLENLARHGRSEEGGAVPLSSDRPAVSHSESSSTGSSLNGNATAVPRPSQNREECAPKGPSPPVAITATAARLPNVNRCVSLDPIQVAGTDQMTATSSAVMQSNHPTSVSTKKNKAFSVRNFCAANSAYIENGEIDNLARGNTNGKDDRNTQQTTCSSRPPPPYSKRSTNYGGVDKKARNDKDSTAQNADPNGTTIQRPASVVIGKTQAPTRVVKNERHKMNQTAPSTAKVGPPGTSSLITDLSVPLRNHLSEQREKQELQQRQKLALEAQKKRSKILVEQRRMQELEQRQKLVLEAEKKRTEELRQKHAEEERRKALVEQQRVQELEQRKRALETQKKLTEELRQKQADEELRQKNEQQTRQRAAAELKKAEVAAVLKAGIKASDAHPLNVQFEKDERSNDRSAMKSSALNERPAITVRFTPTPLTQDRAENLSARLKKWDPYWSVTKWVACGITSIVDDDATKVLVSSVAQCSFSIQQRDIQEMAARDWGVTPVSEEFSDGQMRLIMRMLPVIPAKSKDRADTHLWPKGTFVVVNSSVLTLRQRKQQSHDHKKWQGLSYPLDLTAHIRNPTGSNQVKLCTYDNEQYFYAIALCKYNTPTTLFKNYLSEPAFEKLSRERSTARATTFTKQALCMIDDSDDEAGAPNDDAGKFVFTLTCPFSKAIMSKPVRGKQVRFSG